ncbi:hypothetical protein GF342_02585 [Candidatus Woesearchaeota archaeon]|nr:hypothetical protein [Candidatus Woesearchaeota archaeon]
MAIYDYERPRVVLYAAIAVGVISCCFSVPRLHDRILQEYSIERRRIKTQRDFDAIEQRLECMTMEELDEAYERAGGIRRHVRQEYRRALRSPAVEEEDDWHY